MRRAVQPGNRRPDGAALFGSQAQAQSKRLISEVADQPIEQLVIDWTAREIAEARASEEARKGLAPFLEKRKPKWRL